MPSGRPKKIKLVSPKPIEVYYELDRGKYRWWQTNWFHDQYLIIEKENIKERLKTCADLGIRTVGHLPSLYCECGCKKYA